MKPRDSTQLDDSEKDAIRRAYRDLSGSRDSLCEMLANRFNVQEATVRLLTRPGWQAELPK